MWAGSLHSHCRHWGSSQRGRQSLGSDLSHCKADSYVWSVNHSLYAHISVRWILSLKLGEMNLTPKSFSSFLYLLLSFQRAVTLNRLLELAITSLFLHLRLNRDKLTYFGVYFPNSISKMKSNSKSSNPSSVSVKPFSIYIPQPCIRTLSSSNFHIKLLKLSITADSSTWLSLSDCYGNIPHLSTVFSFSIQILWNIASGEFLSIL